MLISRCRESSRDNDACLDDGKTQCRQDVIDTTNDSQARDIGLKDLADAVQEVSLCVTSLLSDGDGILLACLVRVCLAR